MTFWNTVKSIWRWSACWPASTSPTSIHAMGSRALSSQSSIGWAIYNYNFRCIGFALLPPDRYPPGIDKTNIFAMVYNIWWAEPTKTNCTAILTITILWAIWHLWATQIPSYLSDNSRQKIFSWSFHQSKSNSFSFVSQNLATPSPKRSPPVDNPTLFTLAFVSTATQKTTQFSYSFPFLFYIWTSPSF